jgi:hypothetical protein
MLEVESSSSDESVLVLGDGGLWNNLATTWQAERTRVVSQLGVERLPHRLRDEVALHLVVDASAPVLRRAAAELTAPISGLARSLIRASKAMLQSTVDHNRRLLGWHSQWTAGGPISHGNLLIRPRRRLPAVGASAANRL